MNVSAEEKESERVREFVSQNCANTLEVRAVLYFDEARRETYMEH